LRLRAEANEHLARWADAQTAWETIVDLNEDDDETWFRLADSARLAGDWQTAVRAAERALELSPDHHPAMATLGTAFADAGDNTKAREMLDLVLTLDDSYEFALAQRAHVATTLEDALRDIDRLEALSDDIGLVHRNRGWVYMDYDMYKEALVSFEQALAVDPDDVSALTNAAICSTSLGRPERAVELAERAIAAQPDEVSALVALGSAQDLLGAPDEALLHLRRAYDLAPTIAGVLDQLLDTLRNLDRVEESLAILRELVVRRRENAATWRAVGRHLVEMGYFEEAVEPLRHSLALNSNQPWAHSNLGLALEMSDRPDLDAARQHFERANALGSGLGLQLNLADIQHRLGDSSAPELYRTVVRLADQASGSDAYARWRKGWSLFRLGELERAGRQLFNLTSLPKDGDQVRLDLALVSLCRGREEESLQHYRATIASLASRDGRRRRNALIIARVDLSVARRDWQMNDLATADTIDALLRKAIDDTPRISVADLQPEQSPEATTDRN
jgi:tetratricopeptide (TPR) repeat protein